MSPAIRTAVIGVGALGAVHARVLSELDGSKLTAILDADPDKAREVARKTGAKACESLAELLDRSDAVVVAAPTPLHFDLASACLKAGRHVLVEKPMTRTLEEGQALVALAREQQRVLMVGHVERFNPAVVALLARDLDPRFLEAHRVSPFSFRSREVGVVLDLMIHDIDLILHLVRSPLKSVHAVGIGVLGQAEDMANARLVFENGAVANVTASRLALKVERKLRLFSKDCYVSLDFRGRSGRIVMPAPGVREKLDRGEITLGTLTPLDAMTRKLVRTESLEVREGKEPLAAEAAEFLSAIREGRDPAVPGEHGLMAMRTAEAVIASIGENLARGGI